MSYSARRSSGLFQSNSVSWAYYRTLHKLSEPLTDGPIMFNCFVGSVRHFVVASVF